MHIPKKLKVGGMTYKVDKNYNFKDNELMGQAVHSQNIIKLSERDQQGHRYPQDKKEETFMHEVIHAVDCIYNSGNLDEKTVCHLSQGMYQTLKDNKMLK